MKKFFCGCAFALLSGVLYGLSPIASKFVYQNGGTPIELIFLRALAFVVPMTIALIKHQPLKTDKKEFPKLVILGVLGGAVTPFCVLTAYSLIPAGTATTIHFLYCAFILLGCAVIFKEKLNFIKCACVVLCVVGVGLLYTPSGDSNLYGMLIALVSAVAYAAYSVFLEKSGLHKQNVLKLQFYVGLVSAVVIGAVFIPLGQLKFEFTPIGWVVAIVYSGVGMIAASLLYQSAVHIIGSQRTAILSTFEPLTGIILGIVLYNETMTVKTGIGMALILAAAVTVTAIRGGAADKARGTKHGLKHTPRVK